MGDFDPGRDNPIFTGGQAHSLGRPAPRHFLTLMPAELRQVGTEQSGRRELAEAIASPRNPLTARVMVNRVWHYVFGRGLVATTDNFGRYGEQPTNQELLDFLAARFVEDGWSVKKLIRLDGDLGDVQAVERGRSRNAGGGSRRISSGAAIRCAGWTPNPFATAYWRSPAGSTEPCTVPASNRIASEPKEYRRLFQGPLDGNGRRSIYLKITRMEGPRFLELFDLPAPLQTRGNRDVTNVASQSLALLNDPFVLDQARCLGRTAGREKGRCHRRAIDCDVPARPSRVRRPVEELKRWHALTAGLAAQHQVADTDLLAQRDGVERRRPHLLQHQRVSIL